MSVVGIDRPAAAGGDMGRQPPQDLAAEQSVLGAMLLSKDAIADVVERMRPDDFYRPNHQLIFDVIVDLYGRGEPADAVMVAAELDRRGKLARVGGAPYLHTLIALVPTAANAGYYAGIVAEKALLRRLVQAGTRVVQYGYAGAQGAEVGEIVDRAQAEIYGVTEQRLSEDYVAVGDLLQSTLDDIDALSSGGALSVGVPTGFVELDELTQGLHPGQLVVVAARPGVGKALALDTPLPTPSGWTTMGHVKVGQQLLGADGQPTRVVAATAVMLGRPCFDITFGDGTVITADAQHQWPTTAGLRTSSQLRPGDRVRAATAVELPPAQPLAVSPYAVGRWLGGETTDSGAVSEYTAWHYLRGSLAQRRDMLRGLLDASARDRRGRAGDGFSITPRWHAPQHRTLAIDLLGSLGYVVARGQLGERIDVAGGAHEIVAVEARHPVPVRCVQVDNTNHLYLAGRAMVPTHNSTLALDLLRSCSIKHRRAAVMFSLEMSKSEIVMRLLSAEAKIKLANLRSGHLSDSDWVTLARLMGEISDAPLYIDDSANLTMMEIRAKARRLKQKAELSLIVVDYLQLMTSGRRYESRQQEVSDLSRCLKLLAKELDVPVVALSQLNRGPEQRTDKRPQLSDLRESGAIEQDSDVVILIHRPDLTDPNDPRSGEADLIVAKHRNGPTRRISVAHQLHLSRFANMAQASTSIRF
ncbi:replicative DNA helicase [Mycobacterium avium]|uniref:replicative DNA helicase n=1 Tax=Mycobacterium avium TaxID=1764 RepID=UPI000A0368E0|nr:replicative DNA helicase [Mycobacterium avium]